MQYAPEENGMDITRVSKSQAEMYNCRTDASCPEDVEI
jgi:hypothetical protein